MTSKFSIYNRELLQRISSGEAVVGIDFGNLIVRELAAFRLAAMDSEPVSQNEPISFDEWSRKCALQITLCDPDFREKAKYIWDSARETMHPAPVVPDELNTRTANDVMNEHLSWKDYGDAEVFCIAWNACRAAMLTAVQQSPGREPATVPGTWIPVSEQMPEIGDIVLTAMGVAVNVGEMECSAANYRFFTSVISGRELPATHWMPLPAGPQEVR
ncbi:Eaa1 [Klebsiella pneumoniae]|uniref:DUF551 domain-containing protein n=1 Tax=Klebsiella pneumoniae TaxID=573 RepID=UPI000E2B0FBD|nr:DUF551 domain-containing protein [Klebsiella pneumoniae]QBP28239.1 Eaa1 [Klebsiella phage ST15-VIM1phi2.1]MDX7469722.1 DUF551 domain-containing protein [Klebsiella pneumoniae]CAF3269652.1 hypothetical protein AI3024V1_3647 [Klebsiella pneumoniae]CAF3281102.1 hypothetical protein AI3025V1_3654 [Klebsiella pneumoniae]CAH5703747.1 hypothetical protein AI3024V1_3647 [Klebsiella pneumoniae]